MKAIVIEAFGGPEKLRLVEVEKPVPGDNEVLIRIYAAGVNPVDAKIRSGQHVSCKNMELPAVLGKDMSGVVEAIGKNVTDFNVGDAVFGCISKTYAAFAIADPEHIVKKPDNVSFEDAAAVSLAALTAYQAIYEKLKVSAGQQVLVQSAAGGVGHLAVQFAKLSGATVSGTASAKNLDFLRSIGVELPIDYKTEKFEDLISGYDAVMDTMGGEVLYRSISCVKPGGKIVCLPSSTKDDPKAISLAKEAGVEMMWFMMAPNKATLEAIADLMADNLLKVEVAEVFPVDEISMAHQAIESQRTRGKIIIRL